MLVILKKRIIFVNIYVLFVVCEADRQSDSDHVIITHLGPMRYDPIREDPLDLKSKTGGYFKAEIFSVPVNDTDEASGNTHQSALSSSATVPVSSGYKVTKETPSRHKGDPSGDREIYSRSGGSGQKMDRLGATSQKRITRRAYHTISTKSRRQSKEPENGGGGGEEQISTGPIRITSPDEGVKVDGYLKGEVITGLGRPTKLKVEDPPPGWKPLIKPGGFNFETKSKLRDQDAKKRLGPTSGGLNQLSGNLDSMRNFPLRRNPLSKVYGYPSIVELPPQRNLYMERDPMRSYGPGFYSNYYPADRLNQQNYYFNGQGFNGTGLVPTERFRNRFDLPSSGFRNPGSFGSLGPSPRFGYATYYPTDLENDDFYSRIRSPGFDTRLEFPASKWTFKTDLSRPNLPVTFPGQSRDAGGSNRGLGGGGGGGGTFAGGEGAGFGGGAGGNGQVSKSFQEVKNNNNDNNQVNIQRTVDTQENFGTKTDFY
ncbi:unnamed protein product [Bemisia tabaci]|uniref:Uncharacterized protein n=1 Tax=Bemisia tabaci TaxID=7038 RepID=A0A9P0AD12_BEMTA|nr:unnamed protein product [Bemisia tabaci]